MTRSLLIGLFGIFLFTALSGVWNGPGRQPAAIESGEEVYDDPEEGGGGAEASPPPRPAAVTAPPSADVATSTVAATSSPELYRVVRVIDGDTIVIDYQGAAESVRMIGIDTPETVHPSKPVQCFGQEASKKTREWLEGARVRLEVDPVEGERDKYRRLLGYIHREDGLFVNLELISQGYAYEYTYNTPYLYQAEFRAAEAEARAAARGLWAAGVCE